MTLAVPKRSRDQDQDGAAVPHDPTKDETMVAEDRRPAKKVLSSKTMTASSEEASEKPSRRRGSRSFDSTQSLQIKRSHEANQERAYVAASRRADRSLEARVQSARAASEIHKRRTGKGFKISEEIVLKEEMYEEEEDETPRPFRLLAAHLQTSSPYFNHRVNAFLTNRVAMATLNHQREVERMFAQQFPNAQQFSQQLHQSIYYQSMQPQDRQGQQPQPQEQQSGFASPGTPTPPAFPAQGGPAGFRNRSRSEPEAPQHHMYSAASGPPARHSSLDDVYPTPHASASSDSASRAQDPRHTSFAPGQTPGSGAPATLVDSPATTHALPQSTSSFTSDLSPDARMLASIDMSDPLARVLMGTGLVNFRQMMGALPMASQMPLLAPDAPYFSPHSHGEPSSTSAQAHQSPHQLDAMAPSVRAGAGPSLEFEQDPRLHRDSNSHEARPAETGPAHVANMFTAGLTAPGHYVVGTGDVAEEAGLPDNDDSWLEFLNTEDVDQADLNASHSLQPLGAYGQVLEC